MVPVSEPPLAVRPVLVEHPPVASTPMELPPMAVVEIPPLPLMILAPVSSMVTPYPPLSMVRMRWLPPMPWPKSPAVAAGMEPSASFAK